MRTWAITATVFLIVTNVLWFGICRNFEHLYDQLDAEYNRMADTCKPPAPPSEHVTMWIEITDLQPVQCPVGRKCI